MQYYELYAYLGDFADNLTAEQKAALRRAAEQIEQRWPDADDSDLRRDAFTAAAMLAFGDATDEGIASEWASARRAERDAHARLTGAIIWGSIAAPEPETRQAERLGVTRMTVRKALGK